MLDNETNSESENNANQGFEDFCGSIFDLPDLMKPLESFIGVDFLRDEKWRVMGHNCVYERNKHDFYYTLPIYAHLLDEIKYKETNDGQEVEVKPKPEEESSFNKFLYNPLVIFATSVLSIINVLNILPLYKLGIVMPAALGGAIPLYGHVILLLSSVLYSLPIINQKINKDFSNIIDKSFVEIEKNEYKAASSILYNMPLLNKWVLHKRLPYFTIDKHLKAKFYYYCLLLTEKKFYYLDMYPRDCLDAAYKYTDDPKLKFLILVKYLNIEDNLLLRYEEKFKKCKTTNETWLKERSAHERSMASCKKDIKKIMNALPDLPYLHREKCKNYVALLKNCFNYLTSSDEEKRAQGIKQFDALEHEGYYRYYLPEATIVYYQLDLLICFFREDKNNYIGLISNVDKHMKKASKYINEYLPQLAEDYNTYIVEFKKICFEIDNAYKSPPQYTPALRAAKVKENISTLTSTIEIEVIDENTPLLNDVNAKDNEKSLTDRESLTPTL